MFNNLSFFPASVCHFLNGEYMQTLAVRLVSSSRDGFDQGKKNRISLFFVKSPDFFMGLQISLYQGLAGLIYNTA